MDSAGNRLAGAEDSMMRWLALILLTAPLAWAQSSLDPRAAAMLNELPPHGAVGEWRMLSAQETADESGNGNSLSLSNGAAVSSGWLELNGTNQFAQASDQQSLNPRNSITIVCWYILSTYIKDGERRQLVGKESSADDRAYYFSYYNNTGPMDRFISLVLSSNGTDFWEYLSENNIVTTGLVSMVAATYDGPTLSCSMYFQGERVYSFLNHGTPKATLADNIAPLTIGKRRNIEHWPGKIGLVRIFDRALSPDEIQRLYLEGPPK
jgi:hypothetical protein